MKLSLRKDLGDLIRLTLLNPWNERGPATHSGRSRCEIDFSPLLKSGYAERVDGVVRLSPRGIKLRRILSTFMQKRLGTIEAQRAKINRAAGDLGLGFSSDPAIVGATPGRVPGTHRDQEKLERLGLTESGLEEMTKRLRFKRQSGSLSEFTSEPCRDREFTQPTRARTSF